jgi:ABC-type Fe3+ transport system substrate-binding protein
MSFDRVFAGAQAFLVAVGTFVLFTQPAETLARSPALERVVAAAKKEGTLTIQWSAGRLGGDAGLRNMIEAMNKNYGTNIKLQFTPGPDFPTMLNKLTQEKAAGQRASSDIFIGTANHIAEGTDSGMLKKLEWNGIVERPAPADANMDRVAPKGGGIAIASRIVGIMYNTNLVKGDDVPDSMEDVFKPKWKGKIASTPYATGLYQFAAPDMLGYEYMKKYTQRLANQIGGLFSCNVVERVASGEFAMLVFDCGHDDALRYKRRGAPVDSTPIKEIARINITYFGIPEHAQHPNTGILFSNFLHTEEGQKLQWKLAGHDLHIYPEAETRIPVQKVVKARGKLAIDTVQREYELGHEFMNKVRDEFVKILKEGGR